MMANLIFSIITPVFSVIRIIEYADLLLKNISYYQ